MSEVMIIIGSKSDREVMERAIWPLYENGVDVEVHILSAHRTPDHLKELVENSDADVFIAGAGMAAALPGAVAALTIRPVIGVPLSGSVLKGIDALFSIVQMPRGVPVATVAVDGAENAAILALEILGIGKPKREDAIYRLRERLRKDVYDTDRDFIDDIEAKKAQHGRTIQK